MRSIMFLLPAALAASCAMPDELGPAPGPAMALLNGFGASIGGVQAEQRTGGVYLRVGAERLAPGEHGLHLHAVGRCDGPGFESAGAHWNPAGKQHGHLNPAGAHLGDLPNLTVSANGRGAINFLVRGDIADGDGTSLVVHASPDDYRSEPSGNSGDRVACAVLAAPR